MTGYTGAMIEKQMDFPQFAMNCARTFGALIDMRDEPMDAAVPDEFTPSEYYAKAIRDYRSKCEQLSAMGRNERVAYGEQTRKDEIARLMEGKQEEDAQNAAMLAMIEQVKAWTRRRPTMHRLDRQRQL